MLFGGNHLELRTDLQTMDTAKCCHPVDLEWLTMTVDALRVIEKRKTVTDMGLMEYWGKKDFFWSVTLAKNAEMAAKQNQ